MDKDGRPAPELRPAASLTSGLLARRGDARPAMRRQAIHHLHLPLPAQDDLGWNDIGDDFERPQPTTTSLIGLTPPDHPHNQHRDDEPDFEDEAVQEADPETEVTAGEPALPSPVSPLTERLEVLAERISQAPARDTGFKPMVARKVAPRGNHTRRENNQLGRKAAFTLRLDPERHLRLRLLSALRNCSSQQLLIEALDALLALNDKVEDLAGQVEHKGNHHPEDGGLKRQA